MQKFEILQIENIDIFVTRKKMHSIRLAIKNDCGKVTLSAPFYVPKKMIENFVIERLDWIKKHKEKTLANQKKFDLVDGSVIYFFDTPYTIKTIIGKKNSIKLCENFATVSIIQGQTQSDILKNYNTWRKNQLKKILPKYFEKWSKITGLEVQGFSIRNMKSRWGSCNTLRHTISINLQIINKPEICLDYLVLHEVAHIKIPSHNQDFKNFLTKYMPDWRMRRKLLKL